MSEDLLKCEICGAKRKNLAAHVYLSKDHPSWEKYKEMYPDTESFSEGLKDKIGEKTKERLSDPKNHPLYGVTGKDNPKYGQKCPAQSKAISGENHPLFKEGHSEESKQKISENHWDSSRENNPMYIDGRSSEPYSESWTDELKEEVRKRDENKCVFCGLSDLESRMIFGEGLVIHHVNGDKKDSKPGNLLTLCFYCHSRWHRRFD